MSRRPNVGAAALHVLCAHELLTGTAVLDQTRAAKSPPTRTCSTRLRRWTRRVVANFWQNFARFRLYRHRSLQENTRFSAFFKIYQIIQLKILKFGNIFQFFQQTLQELESIKFAKFQNFSYILL